MIDVLRGVDDTFRKIPSQGDPRWATRFETRKRYRVEFLTPNTGSDEHAGKPAPMPALGGAGAQPFRFLDFLIHSPVRSVLLHGSGVSVLVPAPERYAIHKLIVASRRANDGNDRLEREKDVRQAALLAHALMETRRHSDLADAFAEASDRAPSWREGISRGLSCMAPSALEAFRAGVRSGLAEIGLDPAAYGLPANP